MTGQRGHQLAADRRPALPIHPDRDEDLSLDAREHLGRVDGLLGERKPLDGRELVEPLVDECERCLEAQIVASADLVDIGVILGTGFAPFLGGPLKARADGEA